ncbi:MULTISPECIES: translesion DNA synthesis-associated protein ImuA [Vibrio]|uniref:SOS cell division inhibitor n=2 Tax=Vibrio TaxID=662 RepID=A0AA34XN14_9VIBR|nr:MULTISPECIES: translesion DNA synthesis-associated protein ImuA [Vibrio]MBY7662098.1 translesion DNA synthesis-associated protein ImuA [Vibrio atlanticus]ARP37801.1 SOS cell division inhibitor [Vibrio syngnathi]KAA8601981.1 RecA/RadA recombinase [Vibrio cyclitrophicus]MCC4773072.1 translesion DNA synthesis-associated protein ImuA [Vibrio cyclitrophicus]MCC4842154.1 translesion DNA synthesis-associated protein ImuA [Vibrio cyclitrophicus]|tara:strand:- start:3349 stop:4056 length:708 start_codon:yes stop_codon:yes gene_type:complete
MHELIKNLQDRQLIWKGLQSTTLGSTTSTGYPQLDKQLDGGFPTHGVIEVESQQGIGELRLLTPYLAQQNSQKLAIFINPPGKIGAEFFSSQRIQLENILVIEPQRDLDALWAAEQCLKSGACHSVLLWGTNLEIHQTKRLQAASETGKCLQFHFKATSHNQLSLPVSLSMKLSSHAQGLKVEITKRKGSWSYGSFILDMTHNWPLLTEQVVYEDNLDRALSGNTVLAFPIAKQG